jgi:hypothetical protein
LASFHRSKRSRRRSLRGSKRQAPRRITFLLSKAGPSAYSTYRNTNNVSLKDRRRRPEWGEWEPIKIPRQKLVYVPKPTQRDSLLTRSRLRSYRQAISPWNRVRDPRIIAETRIDAGKNVRDYGNKNQTKLVQALTGISSNILRACLGNHRVKSIRTKKTQSFLSGSSRTIPTSTCKKRHQIENPLS